MTLTTQRGYIRPKLDDHKVLYKGLRYWVFEISKDFPWDGLEEHCSVAVFDGEYGVVSAFCNHAPNGGFEGYIEWGQSWPTVSGATPKDLVDSVIQMEHWIIEQHKDMR